MEKFTKSYGCFSCTLRDGIKLRIEYVEGNPSEMKRLNVWRKGVCDPLFWRQYGFGQLDINEEVLDKIRSDAKAANWQIEMIDMCQPVGVVTPGDVEVKT